MHSLNKPFEEGSNSPRVKSMHHYIITLKSSKESFSYMPWAWVFMAVQHHDDSLQKDDEDL